MDILGANEIVAGRVIGGDHAARIAQMRGEREIELVALIDLVDRHQRAFFHLPRHHGIGPGSRENETEGNGRLGHRKSLSSCRRVI